MAEQKCGMLHVFYYEGHHERECENAAAYVYKRDRTHLACASCWRDMNSDDPEVAAEYEPIERGPNAD